MSDIEIETAAELREIMRLKISQLEAENEHLRVAMGVEENQTVVGASHGSVLVDTSGGTRYRISPINNEIADLEAENAELRADAERLQQYKILFEQALSHVDRVFQKCSENPEPILPGYAKLGEDKFAAVERLAEDVKRFEWAIENLRELDYWAVMKIGRHDVKAAIDAARGGMDERA